MSGSDIILRLLLLGLCFAGAAFFAGIETGIISINRLRLHHLVLRGLKPAVLLERFLNQPERLLSTTLVGTNLSHTMFAILLSALLMESGLPGAGWIAQVSGTLLLLIFCEYMPKAWFQAVPLQRSLPFAKLLEFFARVFRPAGKTVSFLVDIVLGRTIEGQPAQPLLTREELVHLASEGVRSGALSPFESRMIKGVFDLSGTRCRDIMVPAERIVRVESDCPASRMIALARERTVNRFPVWDPVRGRYIGIVHIFDVLADDGSGERAARDYMRPPQFIAEHMLVDHVLPRMRVTRQPMTLVADSGGEVVGLITLNDVLKVIVGERVEPAPAAAKAPRSGPTDPGHAAPLKHETPTPHTHAP